MALPLKVKKKGKDQEFIQFSTTPDPRHKMGKQKKNTRKHYTQKVITTLQGTNKKL